MEVGPVNLSVWWCSILPHVNFRMGFNHKMEEAHIPLEGCFLRGVSGQPLWISNRRRIFIGASIFVPRGFIFFRPKHRRRQGVAYCWARACLILAGRAARVHFSGPTSCMLQAVMCHCRWITFWRYILKVIHIAWVSHQNHPRNHEKYHPVSNCMTAW